MATVRVQPRGNGVQAALFDAMASSCEVLVETDDTLVAQRLGQIAAAEAWRIERKYSRYRQDSVIGAVNNAGACGITLDAESVMLMNYAAQCHLLSDGMFDITSGVLRRLWKFDGSARIPAQSEIDALLPFVGFERLTWNPPVITLPDGMELDLGGIGKEYAVDRALNQVTANFSGAVLINFGGDLCANQAPRTGPWQVGVERPGYDRDARLLLELSQGALATSGTTRRHFEKAGVCYGHILNPNSGRPVEHAPLSVTVAAASCVEAGMWATFAMLQGDKAEELLQSEGLSYWCLRA
jgi:thiamine biosynthesis lipoprotein